MKLLVLVLLSLFLINACNPPIDKEKLKQEIFHTEKAFEKMCAEKGIAEAFYFFANDSAVILRQNDSLIAGKENIKIFYSKDFYKRAKVTWLADFVEVSTSGDLAYTYGKYIWTAKDESGKDVEFKGVFHTVWKKQIDKSWKYVWD
jgi:ketosteroid isomerase-like protein